MVSLFVVRTLLLFTPLNMEDDRGLLLSMSMDDDGRRDETALIAILWKRLLVCSGTCEGLYTVKLSNTAKIQSPRGASNHSLLRLSTGHVQTIHSEKTYPLHKFIEHKPSASCQLDRS